MIRKQLDEFIDLNGKPFEEISDQVWEFAGFLLVVRPKG